MRGPWPASLHGPEKRWAHQLAATREGGMRAFLDQRDGPFYPEPFGPKSK
jgi:enoyl-CoA hydratase